MILMKYYHSIIICISIPLFISNLDISGNLIREELPQKILLILSAINILMMSNYKIIHQNLLYYLYSILIYLAI